MKKETWNTLSTVFWWVAFIVTLASLMIVWNISGDNVQLRSELIEAYGEIETEGTIIIKQEADIQELKRTLDDTLEIVSVLTTFQDAGMVVDQADIRTLLKLAATLPYGSPFHGGHRVTSEFGMRSVAQFGWVDVEHLGIDLIPLENDWTVYSQVDGTITDYGVSDIYGKYFEITTYTGYKLFYAHLERIFWQTQHDDGTWSLDIGTHIQKGTRIGIMGETGKWATGPHLHLEVHILIDGGWVPLNPHEIVNFTG